MNTGGGVLDPNTPRASLSAAMEGRGASVPTRIDWANVVAVELIESSKPSDSFPLDKNDELNVPKLSRLELAVDNDLTALCTCETRPPEEWLCEIALAVNASELLPRLPLTTVKSVSYV